ncbi:hypothetical protein EG68_06417 [Paragonimus skrjabini miyazakii]|uniref:Origin recognition complex subunit 2 n=1 Tax=Paragonimus skrjabini miyazakii TaxID=59628 RepID=A0A8S9YNB3_9TREM|nr:hypothetical protein EG68_06417 [Paragonimus skrjabini miyazakii]
MRPFHGDQKNLEPNDQDISRFSELNLTENDSQKENLSMSKEAQRSEKKSSKSMILKAFSSQKSCVSYPDKDASALPVNRPFVGVRKSPRKKMLTEVKEQSTSSSTAMEAVESYFMQHGGYSGRDKTSNRTLSSLCTKSDYSGLPDPLTFERLLTEHKPIHSQTFEKVQADTCKRLFTKWPFYLREGFNILLYGVGSKRPILEQFRKRYLEDSSCIVVPGYELSISIRHVLNAICYNWLQISQQCKSPSEQLQAIVNLFTKAGSAASPLYLIIHNIDGPGLRNSKAQSILAHLAAVPNICVLASVDHLSMPLLWSHNELARFSWIWEDCTTLVDYTVETSYANSPLLQNLLGSLTASGGLAAGRGGTALASLRQVAASLTQNAREIFRIIAEHQLNAPLHETRGDNVGMPLEDLYWRCRDAFLTSSEGTLRAQLTEFRDHKLMKIKKGADGTELLVIPIENTSLRKFVENFDTFC